MPLQHVVQPSAFENLQLGTNVKAHVSPASLQRVMLLHAQPA